MDMEKKKLKTIDKGKIKINKYKYYIL